MKASNSTLVESTGSRRVLVGRPVALVSTTKNWSKMPRIQVKRRCAQCAHLSPRTGSYRGRIGPDSACFRDFPVFAGEGMQFESHLGHA
jgi:hypothetical protein